MFFFFLNLERVAQTCLKFFFSSFILIFKIIVVTFSLYSARCTVVLSRLLTQPLFLFPYVWMSRLNQKFVKRFESFGVEEAKCLRQERAEFFCKVPRPILTNIYFWEIFGLQNTNEKILIGTPFFLRI